MRKTEGSVFGNNISLSRNILQWEWYKTKNMAHFFTYLLLKANWKPSNFQGVTIKRGQLVFGRLKASRDVGLTEMEIRTCIKRLKSTNEITIISTKQYSIITICKYNDYQIKNEYSNQQNNQQSNQQLTNKQPTINQRVTISEEGLIRDNKENKEIILPKENSEQVGKEDFDFEILLHPPKFPTWRSDVKEFLADHYFIQQQAKHEKMKYAEIYELMKKFVYDKNLEGDFKNLPALKKHFGFWVKKHFVNGLSGSPISNTHIEPYVFIENDKNIAGW